ncbi:MAG: hypothetical protein V3W20_10680 [Candidatus Neomarinimicrobiota bacterium]
MDKPTFIGQAEELIGKLKDECKSKSIAALEGNIDSFKNMCAETLTTREDVFDDAAKNLDAIETDCPDSALIVDELKTILDQAKQLKCGGP